MRKVSKARADRRLLDARAAGEKLSCVLAPNGVYVFQHGQPRYALEFAEKVIFRQPGACRHRIEG